MSHITRVSSLELECPNVIRFWWFTVQATMMFNVSARVHVQILTPFDGEIS